MGLHKRGGNLHIELTVLFGRLVQWRGTLSKELTVDNCSESAAVVGQRLAQLFMAACCGQLHWSTLDGELLEIFPGGMRCSSSGGWLMTAAPGVGRLSASPVPRVE